MALHAADRAAPLPPGATVLVLGAGAVGLLCAAVSRARGAAAVVVADLQPDRLGFAVAHGFADAAVVVPPRRPDSVDAGLAWAREVADLVRSTPVRRRRRDAEPEPEEVGEVHATFECTGVESCMQTAMYATAPGGKVLVIGMGTPVQTLPVAAASLREVDLVGVFRYAHTYPGAIELLASRDPLLPDLTKLITQRYSGIDNIHKAFDMAARVKDDEGKLVLKVMIDM